MLLGFDETLRVDSVASVPASLSCHPLRASEGLEALAAICVTVTPRRPRLDDALGQCCIISRLLCSILPVQLILLGGHLESPVLRVRWFWQEMLEGRFGFGLTRLQVLSSSLNRLVPQVSLQYEVVVQGPKMNGAGKRFLLSFFVKDQYSLVHC